MGMATNESTTMIFEFFKSYLKADFPVLWLFIFQFFKTIERKPATNDLQEEGDEGAEDSEEEDYQLQQVRIAGKRGLDLGEELEVLPHSPLESLMLNSASGGHLLMSQKLGVQQLGEFLKHD